MTATQLPDVINDDDQLEDLLSQPSEAVIEVLSHVEGDLIVLGVDGVMEPTLAWMAKRADEAAGVRRKILGASRFPSPDSRQALEAHGIETIQGDLLDPAFVQSLPEVPNVIFMAGRKSGSSDGEPLTWAFNTHLPSLVCRKFCKSRIVAFSTGGIYGMVPVRSSGSVETDPPHPCGEYAMSCLGRERMFEFFSQTLGIPIVLIRLNHPVEMRSGVLVELARKVYDGKEIDLTLGYVNVVWQGDASAMTLCSLGDASSPPLFLNIAGPERLRVHDVCGRFAKIMAKPVRYTGKESDEALLCNGQEARRRYGPPRVSADQMIHWTANWISRIGPTLGKT